MKTIRPGQLVYWRNQTAIVLELKGFSDAILRTVDGARTEVARVADLTLGPVSHEAPSAPHLLAKDKEWDKAVERFELIRPLLDLPGRSALDVQRVADAARRAHARAGDEADASHAAIPQRALHASERPVGSHIRVEALRAARVESSCG